MNLWFYRVGRRAVQFSARQCLSMRVLHRERLLRQGPYLLACTHIGNIEPALISAYVDRPVRWVARAEYYRNPVARHLLNLSGTIPVKRQGVPVKTIRTSVELLNRGEVVGIFPEGGVQRGSNCIFRGGCTKLGVVVMAMRAGVPIVPLVMLGTDKLNGVDPFLPGAGTKLWMGIGPEIVAPPFTRTTRRATRLALGAQLQRAFVDLYQEMLTTYNLKDSSIP